MVSLVCWRVAAGLVAKRLETLMLTRESKQDRKESVRLA